MKRSILMISLLLFSVTIAIAQKSYTGTITDENGTAIAGALISGDEGSVQVLANENGEYTIQIKGTKVLVEAKGFDPILVDANATNIMLTKPLILAGITNMVNVPFTTVEKRKTTGAVTQVNIADEMEFDQRLGLNAALDGKVAGLKGAWNIWGRGDAIVVVDGIPREADTYNLNEVESITVLKDPVSRAMYGAQADQGVILVTTKRGKANKRVLSFRAETGMSMEKALPEFLGAADYMKAYNQALENDGGLAKYSTEDIGMAGKNPFYPDEDFYSDTYLKGSTNFTNISGVASGGNEKTQYFVTMGWNHKTGWFELADDTENNLNLRGAIDFDITDNISMKLDGIAKIDFRNMPNITDYWSRASSTVPNAYPALWNPSYITDDAEREEIMGKAKLIDGMLLGGNNTYTNNIYGDFIKGGERKLMYRYMQFNTGLDWDLNKITPGLKASVYFTFDFMNRLTTSQNSKYAVYNPVLNEDGSVSAQVIGEDKSVGNYSTESSSATFHRRFGTYGTLSYEKKTENSELSVVGLAYRDQISFRDNLQDFKNLTFGLSGNYAYKGKYLADVALVMAGTQKLADNNNMAFTPAIGLGWILSEEDFMSDSETFDFLKLRANFGILKNDLWYTAADAMNNDGAYSDYFLYETAYQRGGNFFYNNRNNSNEEMNIVTRSSNIGWQKRTEFVLGVDAALLSKKLWLEASFFNSELGDIVTEMEYTYPSLMGAIPFYNNYNAESNTGFDLGISYTTGGSEWNLTVGSNLVYSIPKITQIEEPMYDAAHTYLSKDGAATDAIWGLVADGLYAESDFTTVDYVNQVFSLKDGMPTSSYGNVQPGDIKYVDQDGNGIIDNEDQMEVGNSTSRFQYSLYVKLRLKAFDFYALGIGQTSNYNNRWNNYYRFYGEMKYPEFANQAYGPNNKDVNAVYPRLSSTKNNNNYRNSSYWLYKNNWFKIPTLQIAYNIKSNNVSGVLKDAKVFVRAADMLTISKNKDLTQVNFDKAPQTRSFSIGFVTKF
ncbi:SusC/RagA family TonB-linked outer membrane protein [uncultured Draconibacterium sp.]|uniref:SusC/RagA family TonB-linked outer membrane protein n=1 Tax=uncultured Draconibacterium sp. TaxID=1573823 RepID=UPI0029C944F7|nr:SusC/RagA family TonB-linked outer membrane protein [uncultured Draconibacterium sp.]